MIIRDEIDRIWQNKDVPFDDKYELTILYEMATRQPGVGYEWIMNIENKINKLKEQYFPKPIEIYPTKHKGTVEQIKEENIKLLDRDKVSELVEGLT